MTISWTTARSCPRARRSRCCRPSAEAAATPHRETFMCGIAGIVRLDGGQEVSAERVRRMADAIVHRGPDEDGYFFRPGLGLANRRLSIVGLADGRQPI